MEWTPSVFLLPEPFHQGHRTNKEKMQMRLGFVLLFVLYRPFLTYENVEGKVVKFVVIVAF